MSDKEIKVPHKGGTITFQYPAFRGDYGYSGVAHQIYDGDAYQINEKYEGRIPSKTNLRRPTSAETASLVYWAFQNPKGYLESRVISKFKGEGHLVEFTGNLYLPESDEEISNGVILEDDPMIACHSYGLQMNKQDLVRRLEKNDPSVRFVPFGYETGTLTPKELEKNAYMIARYSEEGAQKIAEVASKLENHPSLEVIAIAPKKHLPTIHPPYWTHVDVKPNWNFTKGCPSDTGKVMVFSNPGFSELVRKI